jgi:hypothetical protein
LRLGIIVAIGVVLIVAAAVMLPDIQRLLVEDDSPHLLRRSGQKHQIDITERTAITLALPALPSGSSPVAAPRRYRDLLAEEDAWFSERVLTVSRRRNAGKPWGESCAV